MHERIARLGMKFNSSDPGAVLATVVLLFHQEVQLVKSVQHCSILLLIITEWLSETNESKAAFVFYFVAHDVMSRKVKALPCSGKQKSPGSFGGSKNYLRGKL